MPPFSSKAKSDNINPYTLLDTMHGAGTAERGGQLGCIERHFGEAEVPPESWAGEAFPARPATEGPPRKQPLTH